LVTVFAIIEIILAAFLLVLILLQAKGSSFSGAMGGDANSIFRSRRGFELRLFQFTIIFAVLFVIVALISSIVS
jgi:preprotein translocase subunit SecG